MFKTPVVVLLHPRVLPPVGSTLCRSVCRQTPPALAVAAEPKRDINNATSLSQRGDLGSSDWLHAREAANGLWGSAGVSKRVAVPAENDTPKAQTHQLSAGNREPAGEA